MENAMFDPVCLVSAGRWGLTGHDPPGQKHIM